jgi:hypothetical protein
LEVDHAEDSLMSNVNLPNNIAGGQTLDPRPIQANFEALKTFINNDVFTVDGARALTGALTLPGAGTADAHAVTKGQMDVADAAISATVTANDVAATAAISSGDAATLASAATDATTKADAAQAAAISAANTYADGVGVETQFVADLSYPGTLTTTSNVQTFLDTGNITNTKAGVYIVSVTIDLSVSAVDGGLNPFVGELYVDGVLQLNTMVWAPANPTVGDRFTFNNVWIVAAPASNTLDFKVKVRQASGNAGAFDCNGSDHSFLSAVFVG